MSVLDANINRSWIKIRDIANLKVFIITTPKWQTANDIKFDIFVRHLCQYTTEILRDVPADSSDFIESILNEIVPFFKTSLPGNEIYVNHIEAPGPRSWDILFKIKKSGATSDILINLIYNPKNEHIIRELYSTCSNCAKDSND